ncbi:hypothetical protein [Amylibacter sp. IMCC11727]|uniref:hypothetical protein n=1 Tax=Amylibacter sp. IMCC11727 TaxID=3039851 RepID=UPI00244DC75F|nr:hypothetical protein [Amylibacter sp. IMCC11727]WGI21328.1 hypothetical protein QBD29_14595 [Amylibacter sp. IMCC11727]
MNAKAFAIAILCFSASAPLSAQDSCTFQENGENNCAHFVGCINEGETLIKGTTRGWQNGTLYGETTTGVVCKGTWSYDDRLEKGEGLIECEDGESANINVFSRGVTVRSITGVAITSSGKRLRIWGSTDLSTLFAERYPDAPVPGQTYKCGTAWIPLPTQFPKDPELAN